MFTARRYVGNGRVEGITHIVYVKPEAYANLGSRAALLNVGRAVGSLNKLLPKHQFILIGPGRWGSRGDIKLGVSVTYSDINNTAMLIEVARKLGNYSPDLSFGTHFFQDLVEAGIRYLPLYPDEDDIVFNETFLNKAPNILPELLPDYADVADTVKLIDLPRTADGQVLRVLMNSELEEAVAFLTEPGAEEPTLASTPSRDTIERVNYWQWRLSMAEQIAAQLDGEKFGVKAFYVFGSTKNGTAGPASDIDIMLHIDGPDKRTDLLRNWLDGWSRCLDEMNYLRTGYRTGGLLDIHLVTDEDVAGRTSYAAKIGAVTDAAKELPIARQIKAS
jgi:hypothetical protein